MATTDLRDPRRKTQFSYLCLGFPNDGMFEGAVSFSRGVRIPKNTRTNALNDTRRISTATYFSHDLCVKGSWEMLYMAFESLSATNEHSTVPGAVAHFRIHVNVYMVDGSRDVFAGQAILWLDSGTLILFSSANGRVCHCAPASVAAWFTSGGVLQTNTLAQPPANMPSPPRGKNISRAMLEQGINFEAGRRSSHPAVFGPDSSPSMQRWGSGSGAKRVLIGGNCSDDDEYEIVTHIDVSSRASPPTGISKDAPREGLGLNIDTDAVSEMNFEAATTAAAAIGRERGRGRGARAAQLSPRFSARGRHESQSSRFCPSPMPAQRERNGTEAPPIVHKLPMRRASRCAGLTLAYASELDKSHARDRFDFDSSYMGAKRAKHVSAGTGTGIGILASHDSPEYMALRDELWASPDTASKRAVYGSVRWLSIIECDVKRMGLGGMVTGNMPDFEDDTEFGVGSDKNRGCTKRVFRKMTKFVLRAIAFAYPDIGYCQGMHCIARHLLFNALWMQQQRGHQDARAAAEAALVSMSLLIQDEHYQLRRLFSPGLALLCQLCREVEARLAWLDPVLAGHLKAQDLHSDMYATKWLITIFTGYELGPQDGPLVQTAFLHFMSEGWNAVLNMSVAVVIYNKVELMTSDLEGCFSLLLCTNLTTSGDAGNPLIPLFTTEKGLATMEVVKQELANYPGNAKYHRPQLLGLPKAKTIRRSQSAASLRASSDDAIRMRTDTEVSRDRAMTHSSGFSERNSYKTMSLGKPNDFIHNPNPNLGAIVNSDQVDTVVAGGIEMIDGNESIYDNNQTKILTEKGEPVSVADRKNGHDIESIGQDGVGNKSITKGGGDIDNNSEIVPVQTDNSVDCESLAVSLGLDEELLGSPKSQYDEGESESNAEGKGRMKVEFEEKVEAGVEGGVGGRTMQATPPQRPPKVPKSEQPRGSQSFSNVINNTGDRWNSWLRRRMDGTFTQQFKSTVNNKGVSGGVESHDQVGGMVNSGAERNRTKSKRLSTTGAAVVPIMLRNAVPGLPPKPPKPAALEPVGMRTHKRWWHSFS